VNLVTAIKLSMVGRNCRIVITNRWEDRSVNRERALKIWLGLVGLFFVAGIYPLVTSLVQRKQSDYRDQMMLAIYVTLGVFLLLAIPNPAAHRSLIAFTGWSSLAHAAVMTVQSIQLGEPAHRTAAPWCDWNHLRNSARSHSKTAFAPTGIDLCVTANAAKRP
jgi:hypothetical protein